MDNILTIETDRTSLTILPPQHAELILNYYISNQQHLAPWEPARGSDYLTVGNWQTILQNTLDAFYAGTDYRFAAIDKQTDNVIGVCNFSNVVHGAFQACHLGYSIAESYQGKGYMHEILQAGIGYIFNTVGLHRVMANYIPDNKHSENLLLKLGFEREGLAKAYLKIAGRWQDHILTSKLNQYHN